MNHSLLHAVREAHSLAVGVLLKRGTARLIRVLAYLAAPQARVNQTNVKASNPTNWACSALDAAPMAIARAEQAQFVGFDAFTFV